MGNQVESVHEAAIVEYVARHTVANGTIFTAAERQGHATAEQLHTHTHTPAVKLEKSDEHKHRSANTNTSPVTGHQWTELKLASVWIFSITVASASETRSEISVRSHTETQTFGSHLRSVPKLY